MTADDTAFVSQSELWSHCEGVLGTLGAVDRLPVTPFARRLMLTRRRAVDLCRVRSSLCRA